MAYVPVLNTAMCELRQQLDGEEVENTTYWTTTGAWTIGGLQALANFMADWWTDTLSQFLSSGIKLNECFVTDLTSNTAPVASYTTGLPAFGIIGQESEPNNVAACLSIRTANRGRSMRGRNYIAGIPSGSVTQNTLSGDWMASVHSAYVDLLSSALTNDFTMVVVSRYSGYTIVGGKKKPTPRAAGVITPVTNFSWTDDTVDSLRTRLPNH